MKGRLSFFKRCIFIEIFVIISSIIAIYVLNPIYTTKHLIIPYAIHPFDICIEHPIWWRNLKIMYIITYVLANLIISNTIYNIVKTKITKKCQKEEKATLPTNELSIYVGKNEKQQLVYIPENSLYQNILITRNNRNWKNKFLHVSIYKTVNTISKSKSGRKNRNANIRCKRKLLQKSNRIWRKV